MPATASPPHGSWERLEHFSRLAGPLTVPPADRPYRVEFRNQRKVDGRWRHAKALLIAVLNVCFEIFFFTWLLRPDHIGPTYAGPAAELARTANLVVIASIAVVEMLRLVNVISLSLASIAARDPIPVIPDPGVRVAFLTTIVPSKEPIAVVAETLRAATRIRHDGVFDIWLLDEGDDPAVKAVCAELGVRHFTRRGIERYNQPTGAFRAKTKHGNYNAWIDAHGDGYDVLLSVDPDHVPLANFAERILGYFRDPDVAYAVGPQCYKNSEQFVTRAAESQQFPFHSVIQRAANLYGTPMLVGTNNAIRIEALRSIGGLSDSITEDMATGLALHTSRNPETGRRWKSVYTPDVLSAGEGPTSWSDYFSQQRRWSRGTFEILSGTYWRRFGKLSPAAMMHYTLITTFYPSMAIGWLLGILNAILFLGLGVTGMTIAPQTWLALYTDATAFSLWLYIHNRRYNVSPYEPPDSWGLTGMLMSIIAAPLYAGQLCSTITRRPARFVVTPKGDSSSQDGIRTFRNHLGWCAVLLIAIAVSVARHYAGGAALLWPCTSLLVCVLPIALSYAAPRLAHPEATTPAPAAAAAGLLPLPRHPGDITREIPKALIQQHLTADSPAPRTGSVPAGAATGSAAPRAHPVAATSGPGRTVPEQRMPAEPQRTG
ncbi:glycosyl transferase [Actinoplanes ianthinogenes]|uniref:Glycosyl transferase n=1 Tax=Actinoplanes ianthinogenes TaxID=122358 RepID=A0ABM7M610_9ACTN|nr:glycosyltransferase family 2 protein [Actinoplanes ianthinogenes]BCJ46990.1 glycosyl transferase [Actinoplanes ianthinogenes]GGR14120.1 glycosyl transferase [Actinoplanes ianthinogenes]